VLRGREEAKKNESREERDKISAIGLELPERADAAVKTRGGEHLMLSCLLISLYINKIAFMALGIGAISGLGIQIF
jgi:hypothetical protein